MAFPTTIKGASAKRAGLVEEATVIGAEITTEQATPGTPHYPAPENGTVISLLTNGVSTPQTLEGKVRITVTNTAASLLHGGVGYTRKFAPLGAPDDPSLTDIPLNGFILVGTSRVFVFHKPCIVKFIAALANMTIVITPE